MRVGCVSRRWAAWVRVIRAQMATFLTRALAVDTEPEHVVRVLYAVPSDREFRADGSEGIAHTVVDVQSWYRQKLRGAVLFSSMGKTGLSPVGAGQGDGVGSTSALGYWVVSGMSGCWLVPSAFMIQTPLFPL